MPKKLRKLQSKMQFDLTINDKYIEQDKNKFRNDFLRQLVSYDPIFKKKFKAFNLFNKNKLINANVNELHNDAATHHMINKIIHDQ